MSNNTIIMNDTNTSILAADGSVLSTPVDVTLKEVTDFVAGGNTYQHTAFDSNGKKTREAFVKKFGTDLSGITSLEAALELSGLNFEVEKVPATYNVNQGIKGMPPRYVKVPGVYMAMRTDTREIIGTDLSESFQIYQNRESFDFLDSLVEEGAKFTNACLYGGTVQKNKKDMRPAGRIMICMELPETMVLGDSYTPYLMFRNGFDGSVAFNCAFVSMRVFCANAINRALKGATNKITIRHTKSMRDRIEQAHFLMASNSRYMEIYKEQAELLALKPFSENQFYDWVERIFPVEEGAKDFMIDRILGKREAMMTAYRQDDLNNFAGTAYRAIQAVSDYESHYESFNRGRTLPSAFSTVLEKEMPLLNKTWNMVLEAV